MKIAAKIVASRAPVTYAVWRRFSLFKHGAMTDPAYAQEVFEKHRRRAGKLPRGFVALELGPGDSLLSALFTAGCGAAQTYLIDVGSFACSDVNLYRAAAEWARARGYDTPDLSSAASLDDVAKRCGAAYLVDGLRSLRQVPSGTVDFIWSNAALEHVRASEFGALCREMRRVLRRSGVASHTIDLRDHLSGGINSLRVPAWLWESTMFTRAGFYTNRLRAPQLASIFEAAGLEVTLVETKSWPGLPTPKSRLTNPYRQMPDEALLVHQLDVVLRPMA